MNKFSTMLYILCLMTSAYGCKRNNESSNAKETPVTASGWSIEKAQKWSSEQPWIRGCNFSPSTAINQVEMWQKESFDTATIDRELGWAKELGFNTMRVY